MPELPEVEATVQYLQERLKGEEICDVKVLWSKTVATGTPEPFRDALVGQVIIRSFRRGKFIGLQIGKNQKLYLFTHLRMSGTLDVISAKNPAHTHDRVIVYFKSGKSLRFNDTRKFGRMYLYDSLDQISALLGIEPLSMAFTPDALSSILKAHSSRVKPLLLNQRLIAGLGNIYVDECLWKAGIHPASLSNRVSPAKAKTLHLAIQETLTEAISLLGTDFGDGVVDGGMYSPRVYGREGKDCHKCGSKIVKIVVGQRGTHLCRKCQVVRT
jgi:formamidopyrimidine-DNA glycosylase